MFGVEGIRNLHGLSYSLLLHTCVIKIIILMCFRVLACANDTVEMLNCSGWLQKCFYVVAKVLEVVSMLLVV